MMHKFISTNRFVICFGWLIVKIKKKKKVSSMAKDKTVAMSKRELRMHERREKLRKEGKFPCPFSSKVFKTEKGLDKHLTQNYPKELAALKRKERKAQKAMEQAKEERRRQRDQKRKSKSEPKQEESDEQEESSASEASTPRPSKKKQATKAKKSKKAKAPPPPPQSESESESSEEESEEEEESQETKLSLVNQIAAALGVAN
jgi:hypothetical protein